MSNTEWKKGYEEGFAAGWRASKKEYSISLTEASSKSYQGNPSTITLTGPTGPISTVGLSPGPYGGSYSGTMADKSGVYNLTSHTRTV